MRFLSRRSLLVGGISLSALPKSEPEQLHFFATDEYKVRMTLEYYDGYSDSDLRFQERSSQRKFCLSPQGEENRNCASDFTGSIAVARYRISSQFRSQSSPSLREHVRSIDQSDHVPVRPPFDRVIEIEHGLASDIQVFGYQDSSAAPGARLQNSDNAWCLLRQDLYLKNKTVPFLVVHWKHTLSSIRVLDIIPENGTLQIARRG